MEQQNNPKALAGIASAALVESGMRVGLGTGSTTAFALEEIGRRCRDENLKIIGTPTSFASERLARSLKIPLATLDELEKLDIAFDGADEVDRDFRLIKGRGAAHVREKVVASLADRFVVLVDESKLVDKLGSQAPLPVEVLPMAVSPIMRTMELLGGDPVLRLGRSKDGPVVTDQGFWILDVKFDSIPHPDELNTRILATPGVLDHGMFLGLATDVFIGFLDGRIEHRQRPR